jgi:hypothetical protein
MMTKEYEKGIVEATGAIIVKEVGDDIFAIIPLAFHCAIYVNPHLSGGCEERYCYYNVDLCIIAIEEFSKTGEMKFWHKHHTKNISVVGNAAYQSGAHQIVGNELYFVEWNCTELKKNHPYLL